MTLKELVLLSILALGSFTAGAVGTEVYHQATHPQPVEIECCPNLETLT